MLRAMTFAPGRGSLAGRVAHERQPIHIADLADDPLYAVREAVVTLGKARTALGVPLLRDGEPIGVINLMRQRVEPFTERQIELVRTFADQAVIAMENARPLGELRERTRDLEESLEYQTATSDVLNVISRSTSDVQAVLDTVAETAFRLCGADSGSILIRDGEVYHYVSAPTLDAEYWAMLRQRTIVPGRDSVAGQVALEGRVVHVADIRAIPDFALPEVVAAGRRTMLGVPLLRDSEPIGIITLNRQRVEPFTERQIELVRTFADHAVIAMENARLLGELQTRTRDLEESLEYQTATSDVLTVISRSTFDLQPILDTLVETGQRLCDSDGAALTIREGDVFRYVATRSLDPAYDAFLRARTFAPGRETLAGRVALAGEVVHIPDITTDPDYRVPETATLTKIRTALGVPLLRDGSVIGALALGRGRVEPYTERQTELVRTFADQAVIAMENARLFTELRESLEQQTATAEVLQVINSSPGELQPVFDRIVEIAARICVADTTAVMRLQDGRYHLASAFGVSQEWQDFVRENPPAPDRGTVTGRVALDGRITHVEDVAVDPDYTLPEAQRLGAFRTALVVPLLRDRAVIGVIALDPMFAE
jgi:GAF domain-containing protein